VKLSFMGSKTSVWLTFWIVASGGLVILGQKRISRDLQSDVDRLKGVSGESGHAMDPGLRRGVKKSPGLGVGMSIFDELVVHGKSWESREVEDPLQEARFTRFLEKLSGLDSRALSGMVDQLLAESEWSDDLRKHLLGMVLEVLAGKDPGSALDCMVEHAELVPENLGPRVAAAALEQWAAQDAMAALAWVHEHPQWIHDGHEWVLLAAIAKRDPRLAMESMKTLDLADFPQALRSIVAAVRDEPARAVILSEVRNLLGAMPEGVERDELRKAAMAGLGQGFSHGDFQQDSDWISRQRFSPEECEALAAGLVPENLGGDAGLWVGWMARTLPKDMAGRRIHDFISQWTLGDYLAAGNWLASSPDGPGKSAAVRAYAETVAEHDPQVAVQWAMTLAAGEERMETLKRIYRNWPKGDPAARGFAIEHGIDPNDVREAP
jgi:hypothetical protein